VTNATRPAAILVSGKLIRCQISQPIVSTIRKLKSSTILLQTRNMKCVNHFLLWSCPLILPFVTSSSLSLKLEVKIALDSRSANVHLSQADDAVYPYTVAYGSCQSSNSHHEAHHNISTVSERLADRVVWILPEDITSDGCLSAWLPYHGLVGRSEPLKVNKFSKQWMKKRDMDQGTRLSRRASIPMSKASGIDAQGPWFDGVELLKEKEIGSVSVGQAKSTSEFDSP